MRRGEVWWMELEPPIGRRPVLLLSRDEAYVKRESLIISPLTTQARDLPTEVPLGPEDGLPRRSVVNLDVIMTVRKSRSRQRIAYLSPEKRAAVERAIHFALDLRD